VEVRDRHARVARPRSGCRLRQTDRLPRAAAFAKSRTASAPLAALTNVSAEASLLLYSEVQLHVR